MGEILAQTTDKSIETKISPVLLHLLTKISDAAIKAKKYTIEHHLEDFRFEAAITGSISMVLQNVLFRMPKDIDIVFYLYNIPSDHRGAMVEFEDFFINKYLIPELGLPSDFTYVRRNSSMYDTGRTSTLNIDGTIIDLTFTSWKSEADFFRTIYDFADEGCVQKFPALTKFQYVDPIDIMSKKLKLIRNYQHESFDPMKVRKHMMDITNALEELCPEYETKILKRAEGSLQAARAFGRNDQPRENFANMSLEDFIKTNEPNMYNT